MFECPYCKKSEEIGFFYRNLGASGKQRNNNEFVFMCAGCAEQIGEKRRVNQPKGVEQKPLEKAVTIERCHSQPILLWN